LAFRFGNGCPATREQATLRSTTSAQGLLLIAAPGAPICGGVSFNT